jgi:KDO2-lipid IV(A) lauroyltransferase
MRRARTWLKYALESAGFRLAALVLGLMSVEVASGLSGWVWQRLAPLSRRHPRALAHLARAFPDKTAAERQAIATAMWNNIGRTFGEAFHLRAIADSDRVRFENLDVFERWASREGGKVACAGHLGNWELTILGISRRGLKPWSIYQRVKNPALTRSFMRLVREGGTIAFLSDLREFSGVEVPFFGIPAPSTTFPALLARSVDAPVLLVRMRRLPGVRFVISYELLERPNTPDRKADIENTTAQIQAAFERYIRDAPEQWMWAHRRWG